MRSKLRAGICRPLQLQLHCAFHGAAALGAVAFMKTNPGVIWRP